METKQERLAELTGISKETIDALLKSFHNTRIKDVIKGIIQLSIEEKRTKIESCTPELLANLQGEIKGMRIVEGAIDLGMPKEDR